MSRPNLGIDLMTSILRELSRRLDRAVAAGVAWDRLIVDPGFGFGKDWRQNLELLRRLRGADVRWAGQSWPARHARASIGRVLGLPEDDRLEGTAATVSLAIAGGADIVRVHDVRAMVRVARMTDAVVRGAPRDAAELARRLRSRDRDGRAYIGMGANLGDRVGTLRTAVQRLADVGARHRGLEPLRDGAGRIPGATSFLNAVVALETTLAPTDLLRALLAIERDLGRTRSFPNAPRTLDLDLLLVGDEILDDDRADPAAPRLHERAFVLVPLAEIAPEVGASRSGTVNP